MEEKKSKNLSPREKVVSIGQIRHGDYIIFIQTGAYLCQVKDINRNGTIRVKKPELNVGGLHQIDTERSVAPQDVVLPYYKYDSGSIHLTSSGKEIDKDSRILVKVGERSNIAYFIPAKYDSADNVSKDVYIYLVSTSGIKARVTVRKESIYSSES